eukprot:584598-Prorocentrum_minimum.AAC.1
MLPPIGAYTTPDKHPFRPTCGDSPGFEFDCEDGEEDCEDLLINPCGLVAWSFFNDTYNLFVQRDGSDSDDLERLDVSPASQPASQPVSQSVSQSVS